MSEISGYPELSKLSQWCQTNLTEFANNHTDTTKQFIATGECWAWLEHLGICINTPDEPSNLSLLTTKIIREEWIIDFDLSELQNVLLVIRKNKIDEADSDSVDNTVELETNNNNQKK